MSRKTIVLFTLVLLLTLVCLGTAQAQGTGFAVTSPKPGETVSQNSIAVRGTGVPGAKAIWDRGLLSSDVVAVVDQGGNWSISVTLAEGRNEFKFRQENPDAGPITLVIAYQPSPDGPDTSDTRVGIGPFSIDLSDWTAKFLYGAWAAVGGNEIKGVGNQIAALMLTNPDVTVSTGGMQSVQNLVDGMILFSLSLVTVMFVVSVWRFSYGELQQPQSALTRLVAAIFLLGFYRYLFRYLVGASNAATYAILGGSSVEAASLTQVVAHIVPTTSLWVIVGLAAFVFVLLLAFVRIMGLVYILVLYALGPLVIPLMMDKSTASYFDFWWRSLVRVLAWSIVWAVEFKLFDAVTAMGVTGGVAETFLAPVVALVLVYVMFKTPSMLPGPTPSQGMQMVSRHISGAAVARIGGKVQQIGTVVVTGGSGAVASGAAKAGTVVAGVASRATRRTP